MNKNTLLNQNYICPIGADVRQRIRHELETNLFKFRFCPHLNFKLIESVLETLPDEVEPTKTGPWLYKRDYEESPGAIKIKEKIVADGYTYVEEYYSSGVVPQSSEVALKILARAAAKIRTDHESLNGVLEYRG